MKREVRTDEIERIRALLATNDGAVPFDVARTLLAALDAKSAEVERLRGDVQRKHEEAWTWMLVAQERARELLANQNRADSSAMETEALRAERDQARRAALEEAIAEVDGAITIYLGHASADEPYDWLTTVREHIAKLLDGPAVRRGPHATSEDA